MRYLVVAASLAVGSFSPLATALAADYSPPPVLRGALPGSEKSTDWSGFYVGGSGSYATINTASSGSGGAVDPTLRAIVNPEIAASISTNPLVERGISQSSRIGFGLYAGYNWAVDDYVVGVEADYTRGKLEGGSKGERSAGTPIIPLATQYNWTATTEKTYKITDYGSFRVRMGYAWDNWLPYVTGGLAYSRASVASKATIFAIGQNKNSLGGDDGLPFVVAFNPSFLQESNRSKFFFGYALGAGLDVAVTQNIIVRAEFQHLRFSNVSGSGLQLNQAKLGAALKF